MVVIPVLANTENCRPEYASIESPFTLYINFNLILLIPDFYSKT